MAVSEPGRAHSYDFSTSPGECLTASRTATTRAMLCSCGQGEEGTVFLSFPLFWVQLKRKKFRLTTEPSLPTLSSPVSSQSPNWTQIRKGISLYRGAGGFCSAGFVLPKSREDQERSGRTVAVVRQVSTSHAKSATQVSQIMRDLMAKTRGHKATRFCTSPHCQQNSALALWVWKKIGSRRRNNQ